MYGCACACELENNNPIKFQIIENDNTLEAKPSVHDRAEIDALAWIKTTQNNERGKKLTHPLELTRHANRNKLVFIALTYAR